MASLGPPECMSAYLCVYTGSLITTVWHKISVSNEIFRDMTKFLGAQWAPWGICNTDSYRLNFTSDSLPFPGVSAIDVTCINAFSILQESPTSRLHSRLLSFGVLSHHYLLLKVLQFCFFRYGGIKQLKCPLWKKGHYLEQLQRETSLVMEYLSYLLIICSNILNKKVVFLSCLILPQPSVKISIHWFRKM